MPDSPSLGSEGVVSVAVLSDGIDVTETLALISVTVRRALNRIPSATLTFADGDMPAQKFPLSDAATFRPGAKVSVKAGYGDSTSEIFSGIVVSQGLTIRGDNDARLAVECRDEAVKMTVGRKNAVFENMSDSDALRALIGRHTLAADVAPTATVHGGLVQHYCIDWDFMLARAEANALVVIVNDGKVSVREPDFNSEAALAVGYGVDLIEFEAELDARHQVASVTARGWDIKTQAALQADAGPATLNAQGNLDSKKLSAVLGLQEVALQTGAPWAQGALRAWANAQQLKSGLSRLRGHMRFQGSARAQVGALVELKGVGERFNGKVYATGLTHEIRDGNWFTEVEFGTSPEWFTERSDIVAPAAAGLVPGIEGLHVGVVLELDEDPQGEHRIQVRVPTAGLERVWARLLQLHASNGFGAFFVPEVGDEVLLGWFNNDPGFPVILGSLYSSKNMPPYPFEAANNMKALVTRSKARLEFNDEDKVIALTTPGHNKLVFSDKGKSITLTDQNGNEIELGTGGITLDSPKDIKISAKGAISLEAVGGLNMASKADVKLEGLNVECAAQVGLRAKGAATAELSASGQTIVKGALVTIN